MLNNEYKNSSLKIFSLKGNEALAQEVGSIPTWSATSCANASFPFNEKIFNDEFLYSLFNIYRNEALAQEVADQVGIELGKCSVKRFSDGEIQINIESTFTSINHN
jgi:hypothetical protein